MVAHLIQPRVFEALFAPDAFELLVVALTLAVSFAIMIALGAWWSR